MKKINTLSVFLFIILSISSFGNPRLVGEFKFPTKFMIGKSELGGISGIQVDDSGNFIAISDARSTVREGKSRFFRGYFTDDLKKIKIEQSITLTKNGMAFKKKERDPEAIVQLEDGSIIFSSEAHNTIERADKDGKVIENITKILPDYFINKEGQGLRKNLSIEGLSLSPDRTRLFISMETALVQDGDISTIKNGTISRILKYKVLKNNKFKLESEYLYPIDKIEKKSKYGIQDNGVSDILAITNDKILVIERNGYSIREGYDYFDFHIKIFSVDLKRMKDIKGLKKFDIEKNQELVVAKKMFLKLGYYVKEQDNIEGISLGPEIDGEKTIILVADNNFKQYEANKFYIFTLSEKDLNF